MSIFERFKFWGPKRETVMDDFTKTKNLNKIGLLGVAVDKDTELYLSPHQLMFFSYMIVEMHPEIMSSYVQYTNFFVGKGLRSRNTEIDAKILAIKLKLNIELKKAVWNYLLTGNVYAQRFYNKDVRTTTLNAPEQMSFTIIRDSSRVYYNLDATTDDDYWLYNIHYTGAQAMKDGKVQFIWIKYALQQISNIVESKFCKKIAKREIIHLRSPYGRNEYYGHSILMSGYSYAKSLKEIIDNTFRIAKYQSLGKKIISVTDENGKPVSDAEIKDLEMDFWSEQKEVLFMNKKISVTNLTYQGEYQSMETELDYVRKSLMSGSIPTFLTAFADDFNNRSLGDDSLIGFFMNLESDREMMLSFFNDLLREAFNVEEIDLGLYLEDAKEYVAKDDSEITHEDNKEQPMMKTTVKMPAGGTKTTTQEPIPQKPTQQPVK